MAKHLQREIERLKKEILSLGATVEESVKMTVTAIEERDSALAEKVIKGDADIDQARSRSRRGLPEDPCLAPAGGDRPAVHRRRHQDQQRSRADRRPGGQHRRKAVSFIAEPPHRRFPSTSPGMGTRPQAMLRDSLDALVNLDGATGREVCRRDDEVDRDQPRDVHAGGRMRIRRNPEQIRRP